MRISLCRPGVLAILLALGACVSAPDTVSHGLVQPNDRSSIPAKRRRATRTVEVILQTPASPEQPVAELPHQVPEPDTTGATQLKPNDPEAERERAAQLMDDQIRKWDRAAQRAMHSICSGC